MKRLVLQVLVVLLFHATVPAHASESAQGIFEATRHCEAFLSFRKGTNPGLIQTVAGSEYAIREVNTKSYSWLRIEFPVLVQPLRWVPAECGVVRDFVLTSGFETPAVAAATCNTPGLHDSYVLAVSWQPGLCAHYPYQGNKPECDWLASGQLVITHLTLHGLWPNRIECGHEYGYCGETEMQLSEDTLAIIKPWMPNFYFEENFGSYQWHKHGTCQKNMDENTYFRTAVAAVVKLNDSEIGRYITENMGGFISKKELYQRVNRTAGDNRAANSFQLLCRGPHLYEIRIKLPRDFKVDSDWTDFLGEDLPGKREPHRHACREDQIFIEGRSAFADTSRISAGR